AGGGRGPPARGRGGGPPRPRARARGGAPPAGGRPRTRIAPGGTSGWHYHDGTLFVLVTRGTLDHPYLERGPAEYPRGHVFREPSGPANAHVARNRGPTEVRILVLYAIPAGSPLSHQVTPPEH
ncbi:cupin domain-containing protein, partial [Nocardia sp. NPDC058497]|uniref:cupin domain-containing protein n=1 Tax=Nocardia sp. NPDC058497 TaxID=3346529 RepID=UPI003648A7BF